MDSASQDTLPKYTIEDYNLLLGKLEKLYKQIQGEWLELLRIAGEYRAPNHVINRFKPDSTNLDRNIHKDLMNYMDTMNARYKELFEIHEIYFTDEKGNKKGGSKKSRRKTRRKR